MFDDGDDDDDGGEVGAVASSRRRGPGAAPSDRVAALRQRRVVTLRERRPRRSKKWMIAPVLIAVLALALGGLLTVTSRSQLRVSGLDDGALLTAADVAALELEIEGAGDVALALNGIDLPLQRHDGELTVSSADLLAAVREGPNTIHVRQSGRLRLGAADVVRTFRYDPAQATVLAPAAVVPAADGTATIRGLVDNAASLTAGGGPVTIEPGGAFTVVTTPGTASVELVALHTNGAAVRTTVAITTTPTPPTYPATAAVHVTSLGWSDAGIRETILQLAREGRINAVQLDIKDEGGVVGYRSGVALANDVGAVQDHYEPAAALDELHALGVRVIGRIVCFRDPLLGQWAWTNGRSDLLVQDAAGDPLATDYGMATFTNVSAPEVRQYHIDLAVEAAGLGFDEILYDYVRRPEGNVESMVFPGSVGSPEVEVARFVVDTDAALEPTGAALGVSVFGIAASRPEQIAQDIRLLAPHVDYLAPMIYPSHWGPGEYDVADPNRQPGDIVRASTLDFVNLASGSGAAVVPWLQEFSEGVDYGPVEVRAQIDAALAAGAPGFLLWNAGSRYTTEALVAPA